jgi:hypothetical protein
VPAANVDLPDRAIKLVALDTRLGGVRLDPRLPFEGRERMALKVDFSRSRFCPARDAHTLEAVIYYVKPRHPHCANFSATAGRSMDRGISSFIRGYRSSEPRITAWT